MAALVAAAGDGDQVAWMPWSRYAGLVWSIARSHRLGPADAADVSQTVWLRLVEHLRSLRDPEHVGGWLATTTRHECLRVIRRAGRELPDEDAAVELPIPDQSPEWLVLSDESRRLVWLALGRLSMRCQTLLRAPSASPDASYAEIAPPSTCRSAASARRGCAVSSTSAVSSSTMAPCPRPASGEELSMSELSDRDVDLIHRIRDTFADIDPVPEEVLAGARAALSWGLSAATLDAELAELVEDTSMSATAGVRGTHAPRLVTFESESVTVEVEVSPQGNRRRLIGQIVPAGHRRLALHSPEGVRDVDVDDLGRFAVGDVPAGPISFCLLRRRTARRPCPGRNQPDRHLAPSPQPCRSP